MTSESTSVSRSIKTSALLVAAWVSFFVLQGLISAALSPRRAVSRVAALELELTIGVLWGLLSIAIAAWHWRLRSTTARLIASTPTGRRGRLVSASGLQAASGEPA